MAAAVGSTSSDSSIQSSAGGSGGRMGASLKGANRSMKSSRDEPRGRSQRPGSRRYTPRMEPDDEDGLEPYRSPDDRERIWLHPSELGSLLPPVHPAPPSERRRPRRRLAARSRSLTVPVLSGMVGAALSLGILVLAGGLDRPPGDRVVERVN